MLNLFSTIPIHKPLMPVLSFLCISEKNSKYQGVKEFHMLVCIGCYCKIMVFSPFELEDTY